MFIETNNKEAIIMKAKEIVVRVHTFPPPFLIYGVKYQLSQRFASSLITKIMVVKALFCQSVKKISGSDIHNFQIFHIL